MAGHSKFKNIMHRKGAQDRLMAKLFSRLGKEISIAVKIGGSEVVTISKKCLLIINRF